MQSSHNNSEYDEKKLKEQQLPKRLSRLSSKLKDKMKSSNSKVQTKNSNVEPSYDLSFNRKNFKEDDFFFDTSSRKGSRKISKSGRTSESPNQRGNNQLKIWRKQNVGSERADLIKPLIVERKTPSYQSKDGEQTPGRVIHKQKQKSLKLKEFEIPVCEEQIENKSSQNSERVLCVENERTKKTIRKRRKSSCSDPDRRTEISNQSFLKSKTKRDIDKSSPLKGSENKEEDNKQSKSKLMPGSSFKSQKEQNYKSPNLFGKKKAKVGQISDYSSQTFDQNTEATKSHGKQSYKSRNMHKGGGRDPSTERSSSSNKYERKVSPVNKHELRSQEVIQEQEEEQLQSVPANKASSKHKKGKKVNFRDRASRKQSIADIVEVENWKEYNREETKESEVAQGCNCNTCSVF